MQVILGLGSNVGPRRQQLWRAVRRLQNVRYGGVRIMTLSSLYQSPAMLPPEAPGHWDRPFYNLVVAGETRLAPWPLLYAVKRLEQHLGRRSRGHWGPREIDVDIIFYERLHMKARDGQGHTLELPHPGWKTRPFVAAPLIEIEGKLFQANDIINLAKNNNQLNERSYKIGRL